MIIYLDVLFFVSFTMDFLLILLTSAFSGVRMRILRAVLAGIFGGVGGVCLFLPLHAPPLSAVGKILLGGAVVWVAFAPISAGEWIKRSLLFFFAAWLLSGALYFLADSLPIGSLWLLGAACLGTLLARLGGRLANHRRGQSFHLLELQYQKNTVRLTAFLDSGNSLTVPETGEAVVLIGEETLGELFGDGCCAENLSEWVERDRILTIPYHTVGGSGVLIGVRTDSICIDGRTVKNTVAAVSGERMCYEALLPGGMLGMK